MTRSRAAGADVDAAAREALAALRRAADPRRRAGMRAYFKANERVAFFGVSLPKVRALAREIWQARRRAWTAPAATRFCRILICRPEFEAKAVGVLVLARWHRDFEPALLRTCRGWLTGGQCANWAAVDLVAPALLTPLVERYPRLARDVAGWVRHRTVWVRRASAVTFVPFARRGRHLDVAYRIARALLPDEHDLIHKASGWLLREAGRTDPARLEAFLLRHGARVPRTTVRYAIERFPTRQRRRLLEATR